MLWADAKKARRIKADMWKQNLKFHQLSYRDMEHLRQVRARDKHPEALGEVTNLELNSASFFSCLTSEISLVTEELAANQLRTLEF